MAYDYHINNLTSDFLCEYKSVSPGDRFGFTSPPANLSGPGAARTKWFHNHNGYELLLLLNGRLNYYTEGDGRELEPGDLVCLKPYQFHRGELLTPDVYDRIVINIHETALPTLCSVQTDLSDCFYRNTDLRLNSIRLDLSEIEAFVSYARLLQRALGEKAYGNDILARAYVQQILVLVNRHVCANAPLIRKSIMPELVSRLFAYIEEHLAEDLSLCRLSEQFHHNGTYISRCFRRITGIPLQQYIIEKRITLAQKYLREGYSPCDVCYMTGFNNYSNFSRTFSRQSGMSPKQYQSNRP